MTDKGDSTTYGSTAATTATATATVASPAPANVQVIAPATLESGYTFDAMYDGTTFTVTVPDGGVVKGQRFVVPFGGAAAQAAVTVVAVPVDGKPVAAARGGGGGGGAGIPTGIWRDGLCDCCRLGMFHPHFLNSLCFRPFLVGQILTRMKMTWLGERTHHHHGVHGDGDDSADGTRGMFKNTFRNIAIVTVIYYGVMTLTATPDPEPGLDPGSMYYVNQSLAFAFGAYVFYLLINLRATIRHVYSIPEESCLCLYGLGGGSPREGTLCGGPDSGVCASKVPIGWEDVCCALWCQLCIVGQMARHTVDYKERRAVCCNATGVEDWEDDEAYDGAEAAVGEGSVLVV